jgi:hypothetical protein
VANKPWERQPGESPKAYQAFAAYLELAPGSRSVDAAAKAVGLSRGVQGGRQGSARAPSRVWAWSAENRWVERVAAWDAHVAAEDHAVLLEERKTWRKQQRQITYGLAMRLAKSLSGANFDLMSPGQLVSSLRVAIAMRNEALGLDRSEPDGAVAVTEAPAINLDPAMYELTPEILAATTLILQAHEYKPDPAAEELDAPIEPASAEIAGPGSAGVPAVETDQDGDATGVQVTDES